MRREVHVQTRPPAADTWVVFVHGFNVDAERAAEQIEELTSQAGPQESCAWLLFSWPSDRTASNTANKMTYPAMLRRAREAGVILGGHLRSAPARRLVLVGHSLGAQVVLRAANRLAVNGRRADGLALLAAAVRTHDVAATGQFADPLARIEAVTTNPGDSILRSVFGAGERTAAPLEGKAVAVGLRGDPSSRDWLRFPLHGDDHDVYRDPDAFQAVVGAAGGRLAPAPPPKHDVAAHQVRPWVPESR